VNMSKEVVVVDGKIMANGGSQEEAISTMTSVRTLEKQFDGTVKGMVAARRILTGETSPTGDTGDAVVCFTADEVQKLFLNAVDGSGTNVVLQGSNNSTAVININGGGLFEEGNYTFSNAQFVLDDNDICEGQTHGRSLVHCGGGSCDLVFRNMDMYLFDWYFYQNALNPWLKKYYLRPGDLYPPS